MRILPFTLILVLGSSLSSFAETPKTKLSVYYESLCPDSRRFITRQLYPLMRSPKGQHVDLELIPYGKAVTTTVEGKHTFQCQHGETECRGNRVHACAIKHYSKSEALDFVRCSMAARHPADAGPECSQELNLDYSKVENCLSSGEGHKLLAENGRKTHALSPSLYFVPWIVYDNKWTEEDMEMSLLDAQSVVCEKIGKEYCTTENRGSRRVRRNL